MTDPNLQLAKLEASRVPCPPAASLAFGLSAALFARGDSELALDWLQRGLAHWQRRVDQGA